MVQAVLFDLGGTLWEYRDGVTPESVLARAAPKAIKHLSPAQAAQVSPYALAQAVRHAYVLQEEAAARGDQSPVPGELCVQQGLAALGIASDMQTARDVLANLHVPESHTTQLLPGAVETLQRLVEAGLRLGIISNRLFGGALLLDDLGYFGISHFFSSMITSCEAGWMKPHPALFHQALEELGVTTDQTVMVGDDLRADIAGALAVGMHAVWMRRPPDRPDPAPNGVPAIIALAELPALLLNTDR